MLECACGGCAGGLWCGVLGGRGGCGGGAGRGRVVAFWGGRGPRSGVMGLFWYGGYVGGDGCECVSWCSWDGDDEWENVPRCTGHIVGLANGGRDTTYSDLQTIVSIKAWITVVHVCLFLRFVFVVVIERIGGFDTMVLLQSKQCSHHPSSIVNYLDHILKFTQKPSTSTCM